VSALEVAAGLSVLVGAALQSATGFGFALVCAPLLFAAFGPQEAIGLLTVLGPEVNLITLLGERRRPRPLTRTVLVLLACAVPGAVVGVAVLRSVDATVLQVLLTVTVFVSLAVQETARRRRTAPRAHRAPIWTPVTGATAGVLQTTTGAAGPPVVLLLLGRGLEPDRVRDTLTVSFFGLSVVGAVALVVTGTSGAVPGAVALAALLPLAALGQLAGRPLFARLAGGHYELVLTLVLSLSAVIGLASALL